jgi:hypothetical protein
VLSGASCPRARVGAVAVRSVPLELVRKWCG